MKRTMEINSIPSQGASPHPYPRQKEKIKNRTTEIKCEIQLVTNTSDK